MSITFWAPDAPQELVFPYPEHEPDHKELRSTLPEIKLTAGNAYAMLKALGVEAYHCGSWTVDQLPSLLERAMKLANEEALRMPLTSDAVESSGHLQRGESDGNVVSLRAGPRMISPGRTDDYVQRTALRFVELLKCAKEGSFVVNWG